VPWLRCGSLEANGPFRVFGLGPDEVRLTADALEGVGGFEGAGFEVDAGLSQGRGVHHVYSLLMPEA
jgi:hypothetical protein